MALGTAGEVDTADILIDLSLRGDRVDVQDFI